MRVTITLSAGRTLHVNPDRLREAIQAWDAGDGRLASNRISFAFIWVDTPHGERFWDNATKRLRTDATKTVAYEVLKDYLALAEQAEQPVRYEPYDLSIFTLGEP